MNSQVICDTGPIIALSVIGRLELLKHLFQSVIVPEKVHKELLKGGREYAGLRNYERANWIVVRRVSGAMDRLLVTLLDHGEAAVIELARELRTELVLIDELKARKIARNIYQLKVIGSARILIEAKKAGFLNSVRKEMKAMRESGYWLSDAIIEATSRQAGE